MITIIGIARSQEQAASAITDLRNRNLLEEGSVLWPGKKDGFNKNGFYQGYNDTLLDGTMAGAALSTLPGMLAGGGIITLPFLGPIAALGPIYGILGASIGGGLTGALIDAGINGNSAKMIEHWLAEGKYVIIIECQEENKTTITELLEGLHGIDKVM